MTRVSYSKSCSVIQACGYDEPAIQRLTNDFGEFLEDLDSIDKVGLLGLLAQWQYCDSIAADGETLGNAAYNFRVFASGYEVGEQEVLDMCGLADLLTGLSDNAAFDLMLAIANQLVAEQTQ